MLMEFILVLIEGVNRGELKALAANVIAPEVFCHLHGSKKGNFKFRMQFIREKKAV